ncbi:MAG: NFACT RNA binding domain-containing protein [bacterium]
MINFDSLSLKAFIDEYGNILESGRIQKIQQPTRREIILNIRSHGENHKLYININPKYPHICILKSDWREIEIPKQPPMFCMLLRKYLEGARILQVNQPPHERIFEIHFESYNEIGEKSPLVLAIELMGKHSNIILYNAENSIILGCAHNIGEEKSKERELAGGMRYIYPQQKNKKNLLKTSFEEFYKDFSEGYRENPNSTNLSFSHIRPQKCEDKSSLGERVDLSETVHLGEINPENLNLLYFDISIPLAKELISTSNQDVKTLYELAKKALELEILDPAISEDGSVFSLFALDKNIPWQHYISTNEVLDNYFGEFIFEDKISHAKSALMQILKKESKKLLKTIETHQKTLQNSQKAEKYKIWADVLTTNMHSITMPKKSVELENYYENNAPILIELNDEMSLNENIQKYYKLYNKTKNAKVIAKKFIDEITIELKYIEEIKNSVEQADKVKILDEIKQELTEKGLLKTQQKSKPQKEKIEIDSITMDDFKIYIGKNNKQNDYIISKIASANDFWLHTFNVPGSHVLIKMPQGIEMPPDNVLLKAAKLAVYYSQARNSVKVDVTCVQRKFLKKPPSANLGYVTFTNETNIIVDNNEQEN